MIVVVVGPFIAVVNVVVVLTVEMVLQAVAPLRARRFLNVRHGDPGPRGRVG
jgi:hypothetical protein